MEGAGWRLAFCLHLCANGPPVSIFSRKLTNSIPRWFSSSSTSRKWRVFLAILSNAATSTTSKAASPSVGHHSSADYFGSFAEVRGAHYRRGYDGELFRICAAQVIESMHPASGNAQRLPGTNLDGRAINGPSKDSLDTVEDFFVGVVLMGRRRQLLSGWDEHLEHRRAAVRIIARKEEPNA